MAKYNPTDIPLMLNGAWRRYPEDTWKAIIQDMREQGRRLAASTCPLFGYPDRELGEKVLREADELDGRFMAATR